MKLKNQEQLLSQIINIRVSAITLESLEKLRSLRGIKTMGGLCRLLIEESIESGTDSATPSKQTPSEFTALNEDSYSSGHQALNRHRLTDSSLNTAYKFWRKALRAKIEDCFREFYTINHKRFQQEMLQRGIRASFLLTGQQELHSVYFFDINSAFSVNGADLGNLYGPKGMGRRFSDRSRKKAELSLFSKRPAKKINIF